MIFMVTIQSANRRDKEQQSMVDVASTICNTILEYFLANSYHNMLIYVMRIQEGVRQTKSPPCKLHSPGNYIHSYRGTCAEPPKF